jgi:hypothetical protein
MVQAAQPQVLRAVAAPPDSQRSPSNHSGSPEERGPSWEASDDRSGQETPVNSTLLWYTTRGAGVVSMVLLLALRLRQGPR